MTGSPVSALESGIKNSGKIMDTSIVARSGRDQHSPNSHPPKDNATAPKSGVESTRPSRNRERISYSDFYKIGLARNTPSPSGTREQPAKDRKDKPSILRFRVKSSSLQHENGGSISKSGDEPQNSRPPDSRLVARTEKALQPVSFDKSAPTLPNDLSHGIESSMDHTRERAGTSPLSSVPSDIEDLPEVVLEASSNDSATIRKNPRSSSRRVTGSPRSQAVTLKRPAANVEDEIPYEKRPSKSKKIKISSASNQRKGSPVDLELLPQESKLKGRADAENKGRSKDDDQGSNNGYCSACQGSGKLLCCEDCPRSFHFICIEPPIAEADVPDAPYYCMSCWDKRYGFAQPEPGLFHDLMVNEMTRDSVVFQLPEYIRNFFENVTTGEFGEYQDSRVRKVLRKDRNGFAEELDPHRLKDRLNRPILCYSCGKSALGTAGIASCDYCTQHWHFDCLNPPLPGPPSIYKKWMCPVHVDDVTPVSRIPRDSRIVDVSLRRGFKNNGNIEIGYSDSNRSASSDSGSDSENEDEIMWGPAIADIPRIKYRIPARGVFLDFLDACRRDKEVHKEGSKILDVVESKSSSIDALVDVALQELSSLAENSAQPSQAERVQFSAIKTLMARKGKEKLLDFLLED